MKLTDEEFYKALNICTAPDGDYHCEDCPLKLVPGGSSECMGVLLNHCKEKLILSKTSGIEDFLISFEKTFIDMTKKNINDIVSGKVDLM